MCENSVKKRKKSPDGCRGKVCVYCDWKLFLVLLFGIFFLGEVVDFFDKGAKHAESLCKAILVDVFRHFKPSVVISRKIEIHCRYANAVETALSESRGIRCAECDAAFFASCALVFASV